MIVYRLTAYRTITWWENPEFSLAAATFGISHPPGGLIPTILGWLASVWVGPASKAFALNLLAGLTAAVTVLLVYILAVGLVRQSGSPAVWPGSSVAPGGTAFGAALGALTLAFAQTIWQHGTYFSPYIFTAFFTILIVAAMVRWWKRASDKDGAWWLFLILMLFGLDFSVHRTNALLLPGLIVWIALRRPRTFLSPPAWLAAIGGLILGLAASLHLIPIALADPAINMGDPSTLSRFWDYVSLKQYGGGWLFNLLPRKAPFWDVQVMDYINGFAVNFLPTSGGAGIVGTLPALLGLTGLFGLWRRNARLAIGLLVLFIMASAGAIVYFNVPDDFFRSMYRHYMPSYVIFGLWMAYGGAMIVILLMQMGPGWRAVGGLLSAVLVIGVPTRQLADNYIRLDGSQNYFCADYGRNLLAGLPEKTILFTFGDNDTFNLWYLQGVEHVRPDVTVVNYWLLNTPWYVAQLRRRDPEVAFLPEVTDSPAIAPHPIQDTTVFVAVPADPVRFAVASPIRLPDSIAVAVKPSIADRYIMASEWILLHMVQTGGWNRPVCFSAAGGESIPSCWKPYLRLEGLSLRIVPIPEVPLNRELLQKNLLEVYAYRGFADKDIFIDDATRTMAANYLGAFLNLASEYVNARDHAAGEKIMARMKRLIPPGRLAPLPPSLQQALRVWGYR